MVGGRAVRLGALCAVERLPELAELGLVTLLDCGADLQVVRVAHRG